MKLKRALLFCLLALAALCHAQLGTVTASNTQASGVKLSGAQACFQVTDGKGHAIPYVLGGGGQRGKSVHQPDDSEQCPGHPC